jgi:hypothetical protein
LRGDDPQGTLLFDALGLGESDTALFSCIHVSIIPRGIVHVNPRGIYLTDIPGRYTMRAWQESGYGATVASGANTNGRRPTRTKSRRSVRNVRAPIGIRPGKKTRSGILPRAASQRDISPDLRSAA